MYIRKIISFAGAWDLLNEKYSQEFAEISAAVTHLTMENIEKAEARRPFASRSSDDEKITPWKLDACWYSSLEQVGWEETRESLDNIGFRPIYLRSLGHIKGRISVSLQRHREIINRWLFTVAPIATKNALIDIPIAVVMLLKTEEELFSRRIAMRAGFERTNDELVALSPLSHSTPFLIFGVSLDEGPVEVTELESENHTSERQIIINRSIEFPPEYYQAGLGILNYFGTVLREKYPEEKAKVKIEQDGSIVRMIVESESGCKEIIEKALQEYEMVIRGDVPAEALFESKLQAIEIRNELRIANMRIESQKELLEHKGYEIETLKQLFGHALTQNKTSPLLVTVSPTINVSSHQTNTIDFKNDLSGISELIQNLSSIAKQDPAMEMRLLDLEEAINAASKKDDATTIKSSSGLSKLRKFIEEANQTGSAVSQFIGKVECGLEYVQGLARKYNSIASWCGAPQVPEIFL